MNGIQYFTLRLLFLSVAVQNGMIRDLFPSPILRSTLGPAIQLRHSFSRHFCSHAGLINKACGQHEVGQTHRVVLHNFFCS
jgi:hypothetical protein